jgi:hypothetical protein
VIVLDPAPVSFAAATAPLTQQFGDRLTLWREGNRVQWSCEGRSAIVELQGDGALDATFVDAPAIDEVTGEHVVAIYRRSSAIAYRLTADGCGRMVDDLAAFFSGTREPRFTFVAAETLA